LEAEVVFPYLLLLVADAVEDNTWGLGVLGVMGYLFSLMGGGDSFLLLPQTVFQCTTLSLNSFMGDSCF